MESGIRRDDGLSSASFIYIRAHATGGGCPPPGHALVGDEIDADGFAALSAGNTSKIVIVFIGSRSRPVMVTSIHIRLPPACCQGGGTC